MEHIDYWQFGLSIVAILASAITLVRQFFWPGKLKAAPTDSFGLQIVYSCGTQKDPPSILDRPLTIPYKSVKPDGIPSAMLIVVPVVMWTTGVFAKIVLDLVLSINFNGKIIECRANRFVQGLGSSQDQPAEYPKAEEWKHQLVVLPKQKEIKFVEFYGRIEDKLQGDLKLVKNGVLSFDVRFRNEANTVSSLMQFQVEQNQLLENHYAQLYTAYSVRT